MQQVSTTEIRECENFDKDAVMTWDYQRVILRWKVDINSICVKVVYIPINSEIEEITTLILITRLHIVMSINSPTSCCSLNRGMIISEDFYPQRFSRVQASPVPIKDLIILIHWVEYHVRSVSKTGYRFRKNRYAFYMIE